MYKKIIHHIVEEHFDHPQSGMIKAGMHQGMHHNDHYTNLARAVESESAVKLRMDAHSFFNKYLWRLRNYLISALGTGDDLASVEGQLFQNINDLGELVAQYYTSSAANSVNEHLSGYATAMTELIQGMKSGKSVQPFKDAALAHANGLSMVLSQLNPTRWPAAAVKDIFSKYTDLWVAQVDARLKKNWAADISALDQAHKLIVGDSGGTPGFADIFASGIIQQFSERFTK